MIPVNASYNSGTIPQIASDNMTTNSNGMASTVLTLMLLPSAHFNRYVVSSYTVHLYKLATVKITLPLGYSATYSGDAVKDVYHFGGTTI